MENSTLVKPVLLKFEYLPEYARFLLDNNRLEDFVKLQLDYSREVKLPLLKFFESMTEEELIEISKKRNKALLSNIIENRLDEYLTQAVKNWLVGELPLITRNQIAIDDITLVSYIRKKALSHFIPEYTTKADEIIKLINEIDRYIQESESAFFKTFFDLQLNLFKQAQSMAKTGNYTWDIKHNKISWSDEVYRIFALPPQSEQITYERYVSFIHPDDRMDFEENLQQLLQTCNSQENFQRIIANDGLVKFLHSKRKVTVDEEGKPYRVIGTVQDITERQELIDRLLHNEDLYKRTEALTHIGNWTWDIQQNKVTWSDELYRIYGLEPQSEDITVERFLDFIHPADREKRKMEIEESLSTLKSPDYTIRIILDDCTEKILQGKGQVLTDKHRKPLKLVGTCQDITKEYNLRKQLEDLNRSLLQKNIEIKKSEERYHRMINEVKDYAIIRLGEDGTIESWNKGAEKIKGYKAAEIIGKNFRIFYTEEDRKNQLPDMLLSEAAKTGRVAQEGSRVRKDGTVFWSNIVITALHDENNKVTGFSKVTRDLTELKAANDKQKEYARQLEQNNKELERINNELINTQKQLADDRTRFLVDAMPDIVITCLPEGGLNYSNERLMDFTGYSFDELKGWGWIATTHEEDQKPLNAAWRLSVEGGIPLNEECRLRRADGKFFWHRIKAMPHWDKDGNITMWIATLTDIHDQKMMDERKDEFIALASHELKTPLTSALVYTQLVSTALEEKDHDQALEYSLQATTFINRLNGLISDLLDISRIQHGQIKFNMTEFDFDTLLEETIKNIQQQSPRHKIIKNGSISKPAKGDKDGLRQVCINLLSNAIKYSPDADKVELKVSCSKNEVSVAVIDNGIGIPRSEIDKVFDRFYRVENNGNRFQGLGIGLFISSEIIRQHNGSIWVESEPGKGSAFHFTIPI